MRLKNNTLEIFKLIMSSQKYCIKLQFKVTDKLQILELFLNIAENKKKINKFVNLQTMLLTSLY